MDPKNDLPKMTTDVGRRTTQVNLWMIVAIVLFLAIAALVIVRFLRHPPESTQEMRNHPTVMAHPNLWAARAC